MAGLALIAAIAFADYASGYELRLAVLNLVPIALVAWSAGRAWGLAFAALAAGAWLISFRASHRYSDVFFHVWEGAATALVFFIFVLLITRLRGALAKSDARFMTVLEQMQAAVCVEDSAAGTLLFANQRYRAAFGAHSAGGADEAIEERRDPATGRWFLAQSRRIDWIDGRAAILRILTDITEVRRAAEDLRRQRELLDRSSRMVALGELGSSLAHELNQPLAAITTYLELCSRAIGSGAQSESGLPDIVEKCRVQALRAGAIVNRLRDLLRHRSSTFAPTDVNRLVHAHAKLAEHYAAEHAARVRLELEPRLPFASADALLVEQVLMNLVRNAIESLEKQPPERRTVIVRTEREGENAVRLSVIDQGSGVPEDVGPHIYDPFFTTKPGGLGLGLGICRSILEAHGGRIWHEPCEGGGTAFRFTLPASAS